MRDWGHDEEQRSVALRIEFVALLFAWALAMLAVFAALDGST